MNAVEDPTRLRSGRPGARACATRESDVPAPGAILAFLLPGHADTRAVRASRAPAYIDALPFWHVHANDLP